MMNQNAPASPAALAQQIAQRNVPRRRPMFQQPGPQEMSGMQGAVASGNANPAQFGNMGGYMPPAQAQPPTFGMPGQPMPGYLDPNRMANMRLLGPDGQPVQRQPGAPSPLDAMLNQLRQQRMQQQF